MIEMIRESLLFMGVAVAIASGASFALAGCGCSDTNDKKTEAVADTAVPLAEDVTPVASSDAVSPTGG